MDIPEELVDVVSNAMIEHGPDGHCDGAKEIARAAFIWCQRSAMKLYFWNEPYPVKWGGSLLFAVAESLDEAKRIAASVMSYRYGVHENDTSFLIVQSADLGEPTRVLNLPCAEWHEWES